MAVNHRHLHERELGRCMHCGNSLAGWHGCSAHHRLLRSQGGQDDPSNVIMLCGSGTTGCHGWVHHNRNAAREQGYIVYPTTDGRPTDTRTVPVWSHAWQSDILLDDIYGLRLAA
jgi:hypothetical protein